MDKLAQATGHDSQASELGMALEEAGGPAAAKVLKNVEL